MAVIYFSPRPSANKTDFNHITHLLFAVEETAQVYFSANNGAIYSIRLMNRVIPTGANSSGSIAPGLPSGLTFDSSTVSRLTFIPRR